MSVPVVREDRANDSISGERNVTEKVLFRPLISASFVEISASNQSENPRSIPS